MFGAKKETDRGWMDEDNRLSRAPRRVNWTFVTVEEEVDV